MDTEQLLVSMLSHLIKAPPPPPPPPHTSMEQQPKRSHHLTAPAPSAPPRHRYIRQAHPHYNASGGTDHFYFSLNDRGACILNSSASDLWSPIKLVHFGAFSSNITSDLGLAPYIKGRQSYGCFQPGKDVVVAPHHPNLAALAGVTYNTDAGKKQFNAKREILLAFAGGPAGDGAEPASWSSKQQHVLHRCFDTSADTCEAFSPRLRQCLEGAWAHLCAAVTCLACLPALAYCCVPRARA